MSSPLFLALGNPLLGKSSAGQTRPKRYERLTQRATILPQTCKSLTEKLCSRSTTSKRTMPSWLRASNLRCELFVSSLLPPSLDDGRIGAKTCLYIIALFSLFLSYEDLTKNHSIVYVAGGAAQNAARAAQVSLNPSFEGDGS